MSIQPDHGIDSFRTCVTCSHNTHKIGHEHAILSIGSCFAETIASRMKEFHFSLCANPTGIVFNPLSAAKTLRRLLSRRSYSEKELFEHDGCWMSFDHHSSFNAPNPHDCLAKIHTFFNEACRCIQQLNTLILTFGTAYGYYHRDTHELVSNCHRLPHTAFQRTLFKISAIVDEYANLFNLLYAQYPDLNIILTISPVRHLRDNPHENQVSKAHLFAAVHGLELQFPKVYYFPAYEILMDELRDYRFYTDDMVHPAPVAIEYIWKQFCSACISEQSRRFIQLYTPLLQAKSHRIINKYSAASKEFVQKQLAHIELLERQFPSISFNTDKIYFNGLLV